MRSDKNYYHILELDQDVDSDRIKRAYRRLALKYHPDRNPGDSASEEKFKLISEAYAVLINPEKRRQYDLTLKSGYESRTGQGSGTGFNFTREDIFREFFASAHARQAFQDLGREFKKSGYRFDEQLFQRLFPGGQGFYFRGYFFAGSLFGRRKSQFQFHGPNGTQAQTRRPVRSGSGSSGLLERVWKRVNTSLKQQAKRLISSAETRDINYNLTVNRDQIGPDSSVQVLYKRDEKPQKVTVKIPANIKDGARLRLKKMGNHSPEGEIGDLYIHIHVS